MANSNARGRTAATEAPAEPAPDLVEPAPVVIPEPTSIKSVWYPTSVQLPGEPLIRMAKVYATPEGLYVYRTLPTDVTGNSPDWYGAIDYATEPRPPGGWMARNGFTITTGAGPVTLTPEPGCGCHSPLKRWNPEFANRNVAW